MHIFIDAFTRRRPKRRTFGPFDGIRVRRGRYLTVRVGRRWHRLAMAIPLARRPVYRKKDKKGNMIMPMSKPLRGGDHYALWRFFDAAGKEVGFDAEDLDLRFEE